MRAHSRRRGDGREVVLGAVECVARGQLFELWVHKVVAPRTHHIAPPVELVLVLKAPCQPVHFAGAETALACTRQAHVA